MTEASDKKNSYVFDAENASEISRLIARNAFLYEALGGPFPERKNLDGITRILDIGCGPGGWARDVAAQYPDKVIIGIDISDMVLSQARQFVQNASQNTSLQHVSFIEMDALEPLQFPSEDFDLVNLRAAVEFIPQDKWQSLLQECYRITRPGGFIRFMEADRMLLTNQPSFERLHALYSHLLKERGYGFSSDGQTFGITPMLGKLLHNAGYHNIDIHPCALDCSYGTLFQANYRRIIEMRFEKIQSQLLERAEAALQDLSILYARFLQELNNKDFCGITYPLIFWAQK